MSGRVEAIWIKPAHGRPMKVVEEASLVEDRGIEGNADQGGWRQVTVIEKEVFEDLQESLSPDVDPAMRRANLLVRGVRLEDTRGQTLRVGPCAILIRGETRPCALMDQALPGLREALSSRWGGGAFGKIVRGGTIRVGDEVRLEPAGASEP